MYIDGYYTNFTYEFQFDQAKLTYFLLRYKQSSLRSMIVHGNVAMRRFERARRVFLKSARRVSCFRAR